MTIISIANAKGGVGRTTTAVNLGAGLALAGYSVLVIDLDPQANATANLYRMLEENDPDIFDVMAQSGVSLADIVVETTTPGLRLAPINFSKLLDPDSDIDSRLRGWGHLLARAIDSDSLRETDFILCDCPPSVNRATINALAASDYALCPVAAGFYSLIGVRGLRDAILKVKETLNPKLKILGFLLTMADYREGVTGSFLSELQQALGSEVLETIIRVNTRFKSAPLEGRTIFQAEGASGRGVTDYQALTSEVLRRLHRRGSKRR